MKTEQVASTGRIPPAPDTDTVVSLPRGRWSSFGPRLEHEGAVETCSPTVAHYWGVYRWTADRWEWVADAVDGPTAARIAAHAT